MIRPLHDYVLLRPDAMPTTTRRGLHLPAAAAGKATGEARRAEVLAVGPGRKLDKPVEYANPDYTTFRAYRAPMPVLQPGDVVWMSDYFDEADDGHVVEKDERGVTTAILVRAGRLLAVEERS